MKDDITFFDKLFLEIVSLFSLLYGFLDMRFHVFMWLLLVGDAGGLGEGKGTSPCETNK